MQGIIPFLQKEKKKEYYHHTMISNFVEIARGLGLSYRNEKNDV